MALGLPTFLNLMNIELRVIGSELGVSLLFVLEPEVWRATRRFDKSLAYKPLVLCNIVNPLGACVVVRDVPLVKSE
jgi:hypothetical protein